MDFSIELSRSLFPLSGVALRAALRILIAINYTNQI